MTETLDPSLIIIEPDRQRKTIDDIEDLAGSIRAIGLINPIVITRDNVLVAGERRLTACKSLGMTEVPVRYLDDLSEFDRHLIELEENVKRKDLDWRDKVDAVVKAHEMLVAESPDHTYADTATRLNVTASTIERYLTVARNMENPLVNEAEKFSVALNTAKRAEERRAASSRADLSSDIDRVLGTGKSGAGVHSGPTGGGEGHTGLGDGTDPTEIPTTSRSVDRAGVLQADFIEWSRDWDGAGFNLLVCDFPYGVGAGDKIGFSGAKMHGQYDDSFATYEALLGALDEAMDNVVSHSAHMVFWFGMQHYSYTLDRLGRMGWRVWPQPLIWHKTDNTGILADAQRAPRWTYETAFFASRGDRPIVKATGASCGHPSTRRDDRIHTSEKPRTVLEHFLRMLVDDTTRMLDPTCGSGNSVRVAYRLGAEFSLGLEIDPDFAAEAEANLAKELV